VDFVGGHHYRWCGHLLVFQSEKGLTPMASVRAQGAGGFAGALFEN
jgi:hypothetical protein